MRQLLDNDRRTLVAVFSTDVLSTTVDAIRPEVFSAIDSPRFPPDAWDCFEADLSSSKMVDSVGLNFLVTVIRAVKEKSKRVRLVASSPHVLRVLRFTRVDQIAEVIHRQGDENCGSGAGFRPREFHAGDNDRSHDCH